MNHPTIARKASTVSSIGLAALPLSLPTALHANDSAVPPQRMRQGYEEVKTPFKYGVVIRGDSKKHSEFAGNVKAVDSRDLWREPNVSSANQGYHYNRNAETYMEVGLAPDRAMAELLKK